MNFVNEMVHWQQFGERFRYSRESLLQFDDEQTELLKFVGLVSAVSFSIFLTLRFVIFRKYSSDFSNRLVSILHGIFALTYSTYLMNWSAPFAEVGRATHPIEAKALGFSLGYFTYDFFVCLVIEDDITTHMHHVASIAGLVLGSIYKKGGSELICCMFIAEATGPSLHLHYLLKELKHQGSLGAINQMLFAVVFFVARICFGPVLVYHTVMSPTSPVFVKLSGVALEVVSVFWFYKIFKIFLYKLKKGGKAREKEE